jgi:hypothetical protein
VRLAEILLRKARVESDAAHAIEARTASIQARRTGTKDRSIPCHAAAIDRAVAARGSRGINVAQCRFEQWVTEGEAE